MKEFVASILVGLCVIFGFSITQPKSTNRGEGALLALREEIATLRLDLKAFLSASSRRESMMDESLDASDIVTDLRRMKAAALMFYADNMDRVQRGNIDVSAKSFVPYLEPKFDSPVYLLHTGGSDNDQRVKWWVGFDLIATGKSEGVKELLRERANSVGLFASPNSDYTLYSDQDIVWMAAR